MSIEYKPSDAHVIKSVPYSDDAPYGVIEINQIVPNRPAIVIFGGELTDCAKHANHYIKQMQQILTEAKLSDIDIYSVYYDFGSRNSELERLSVVYQEVEENMKMILGTKVTINQKDTMKGKIEIEYYSPQELDRIYELLQSINK